MSVLNKIFIRFFINLIKFYSFFSPFFYRGVCRFNPTCSQYAIQAISKYGPIIGIYKSIGRLLKCHPFGKHQFDKFKNHFSITYLDYSVDFSFYDKDIEKFEKYMLEEEVADLSKYLLAPMPGKIVSINVKNGQKIKSGDNLLILEAMKMENLITATKDTKIKKINVKVNDAVEVDQILIEFDE